MRSKRLKRMEEVDGLAGLWQRTEAWSIRAGNLKRRLQKDKEGVLRWMKVREEDAVLSNISNWLTLAKGQNPSPRLDRCEGEHLETEEQEASMTMQSLLQW